MGTPKTRIPPVLRRNVSLALECWRDYFVAIDNKNGAWAANDTAIALGLEPLPQMKDVNRFDYSDWRLKQMVKNVERYGPR